MTGCPYCGQTSKFGGTVVWCHKHGWVDQPVNKPLTLTATPMGQHQVGVAR